MTQIVTYTCDQSGEEMTEGWTVRRFHLTNGEATYHACDKHVAEFMVHLMFIDKVKWITADKTLAK